MDGVYTRGFSHYNFVTTDVPIQHRGGAVVLYRASPQFAVEAIQQFGPNVVYFQLVTG